MHEREASANPNDTARDGVDGRFDPPRGTASNEFSKDTRVIFVNGIGTDETLSAGQATLYAAATGHAVELFHVETHGRPADIATALHETLDERFAQSSPAEKLLAKEILSLATSGKDVHIGAYSRGAIVTENALWVVRHELERRNIPEAEIVKTFSHVTLETFNGGSHDVPNGVRSVNYVNPADVLVSEISGMGPMSAVSRGIIAENLPLPIAASYVNREGLLNQPSGPVILTPPANSMNPLDQHAFENSIPARKPFEVARAPYEADLAEKMSHKLTPINNPAPHAVDALTDLAERSNGRFPVLRTLPDGTQRVQEMKEPFHQSGSIVSADGDRITQSIGRGHTFTYRTQDVLREKSASEGQLQALEHAAAVHDSVSIAVSGGQTKIGGAEQQLGRDSR